jgi:hypothetical protein
MFVVKLIAQVFAILVLLSLIGPLGLPPGGAALVGAVCLGWGVWLLVSIVRHLTRRRA